MRAQYGDDVEVNQQAQDIINREERFYVVRIADVNIDLAVTIMQGDTAKAAERSTLESRNHRAIRAADLQVSGLPEGFVLPERNGADLREIKSILRGRGLDLYYIFPRDDPFTLENDEIKFSITVLGIPVSRSFKLDDMVFEGQLEL